MGGHNITIEQDDDETNLRAMNARAARQILRTDCQILGGSKSLTEPGVFEIGVTLTTVGSLVKALEIMSYSKQ